MFNISLFSRRPTKFKIKKLKIKKKLKKPNPTPLKFQGI
jgi:hypothetical protein